MSASETSANAHACDRVWFLMTWRRAPSRSTGLPLRPRLLFEARTLCGVDLRAAGARPKLSRDRHDSPRALWAARGHAHGLSLCAGGCAKERRQASSTSAAVRSSCAACFRGGGDVNAAITRRARGRVDTHRDRQAARAGINRRAESVRLRRERALAADSRRHTAKEVTR